MRRRCHHSGNLSYANQALREASRLLKNSTRDADMDLECVRLGDGVVRYIIDSLLYSDRGDSCSRTFLSKGS